MPKKSLKDWKEEISRAKLYQNQDNRLDKWKRYRGWYRNKYPEGVVSVNKVFGIGRSLVPQLYFKSPQIINRPRKPQATSQAKVLDAVDQWLIEHIGFKQQIKVIILDAYIHNIGIAKIGYHSIATELPSPSAETTEAVAEFIGAPAQELQTELEQRKWSYHDYIKPDTPWALRIKPADVLIPWGFTDEHEAPWIAFRVVRPLDDVKQDPVYSSTSRLQANVRAELSVSATRNVVSPNMFGVRMPYGEFVEMWEIWDKREGRIQVLSTDHDRWLRDEEHNMEITGIPATVLRFNPDGEDFWGVPDVEQISKQVFELNENRTHEMEHKRLINTKAIVDTNIIPEEELQKMEKGKPGPFIRANQLPGGAVVLFESKVPPDLFRIDDVIDKDLRDTIGFSRNQQGEFESSRRTATEANIVREASMLRADERRDLVADFIAETFRDKIHPLIFQNWTAQRVIEVTALGGWYKYTGPQIKGDYDVTCIPDSTLPISKMMERQLAQQAFQALNNDPWIKQRRLRERFLEAFKEVIPSPEELLLTEEEFAQQQQQQMQQMLLMQALGEGGAPKRKPAAAPQQGANGARTA